MKNINKRLGFTALVLSSFLVLTACSGAGGNANYSEDEMKDKIVSAFEAMDDLDTVRSNVSMDGNFEGQGEEVALEIEMGIGQEILDKEAMKFNADFDLAGNVSVQDYNVGFSLSAVLLQDAAYVNLGSITGLEENENMAMVLPMIEGYTNKWWSFELPEGGLTELGLPEDADISAQQEELMELLRNAEFFESIELVATEKIGGVKAEKFNVVLSQDGLIQYLQEAMALTDPGQELTQEEIDQFKEVMQGLDIETMVWVTENGYVGGMSISVVGQIEDAGEVISMDFDVMVEYTDFNESMNIEAPEESTPFDLGGFGLGSPMMGGSAADIDPYSAEYDAYMDQAAGIVPEGTPLTLEQQMNPAY